ncbi:hypothetical protein [Acinetobacter gyllenbergii]|uniref:hypothetical protein n=1 Tax=Acinetobacter gyllenbergii TaxID=134534 RepID=UPI000806D7DD|nr:hypothetical protein [Acinetobacter gyllenbergii]OBY75640.1 hypothetical protein NG55_02915 [Acinetobacter gyllenbergii]
MLTILAEVIIAFFVSNYESEKHPYQMSFVKGIILAGAGFILAMISGYLNNDRLSLSQTVIFFFLSLGIGLIVSLFFMLCVWFDHQVEKDKK